MSDVGHPLIDFGIPYRSLLRLLPDRVPVGTLARLGAPFAPLLAHRARRPPHLHRLPLLHDGLPVQGEELRARGHHRAEPGRAARQGLRRELHALRSQGRQGRHAVPCVEACAAAGHQAIVFGDLNDPSSEISKRIRAATTTQRRADLRTDNGVRYQGISG